MCRTSDPVQICCLSNDLAAMQKALEELGFGPCYHMRTAMNQYPRDCAMWLEAFEAKYDGRHVFGKKQWDQLLGHYSVSIKPGTPHQLPNAQTPANHLLPAE